MAPYIAPSLTTIVSLDQGIPTTVVNTAVGTGSGVSQQWGVPPSPFGNARSASYAARGTYSVATLTLKKSLDGGNTFVADGAAIDMAANPAGTIQNLANGAIYRLDVTTFTGTSITVDLALN
jgi:hypothetical protein